MTLVMQSLELLKKEARVFTELGRNLSCCLGEILLGRLLQWHEVSRASFISLLAAKRFDVKTNIYGLLECARFGIGRYNLTSKHPVKTPLPHIPAQIALDLSRNSVANFISCFR